ncbi:MAG: tRNA pseudouridine(38-40) synthase TruA [Bacillota bacterium]
MNEVRERNVALRITYDGTTFHGFQKQPGLRTVQGVLEEQIERLSGASCPLKAAGRTDAGVHARGQVVSFGLKGWQIPAARLVPALNGALPAEISILEAAEVPLGFHPRYDAVSKTYRYTVFRRAVRCPLSRLYSLHFPEALDVGLMRAVASDLSGKHDFSAFQNTGRPVKSAVRTLMEARIVENWPYMYFVFTAEGFLYQMVRILVGTLMEVGRGVRDRMVVQQALKNGNRRLAGPTAPAQGLCLERVVYEREIFGGVKSSARIQ